MSNDLLREQYVKKALNRLGRARGYLQAEPSKERAHAALVQARKAVEHLERLVKLERIMASETYEAVLQACKDAEPDLIKAQTSPLQVLYDTGILERRS